MDYLNEQLKTYPEKATEFTQLADAWQKKLWHQMSQTMLGLIVDPFFQENGRLLDLHDGFVVRFAESLDPLLYAQFAIAAGAQNQDTAQAISFLEKVEEKPYVKGETQASLLLRLGMLRLRIKDTQMVESKKLLSAIKEEMDDFMGILEAEVHSKFHLAALEFYKVTEDASKFYKHSLLYLTYTPMGSIPADDQLLLASDVGLAALLGPDVYNFGELLQHDIISVLVNTKFNWLFGMLNAYNAGDVKTVNNELPKIVKTEPALSKNEAFLRRKVRIMSLMEVVFERDAQSRTLTFDEIATRCDLPATEVEMLLMQAFSKKVVKGIIDQVHSCVRITWVQPRVLDKQQILQLKERLTTWAATVIQTTIAVEENSPELLRYSRS